MIRILFKDLLTSLETGLTSETIMTEIKPLLKNPSVPDKDLIFAVGQDSSYDQLRSVKLNKSKTRPRLNAVETEYEAENELNLIPRSPVSKILLRKMSQWKCLTY